MVLNDNQAVHCPTEELAKKVIKKLYSQGLKWVDGSTIEVTNWEIHKESTCYDNGIHYSPKDFYEEEGYEIISAEDFLKEEFVLPDKWCVEMSTQEVVDYCNKNGEIPPYSIEPTFFAHFPHFLNCTSFSEIQSGYTEITTEQFLKYVLKQDMRTYKLIKLYPGSGELGTTTQDDMSKFPEFWEEVKEKYKLFDWVVKLEGFSSEFSAINYIGAGYDKLPNIFRITNLEDTYTSHIHLGEQCLGTEEYLIFSNGVRKATKEEIKAAQTTEIGEYKVEKTEKGIKVGCQEITTEEIETLKRMVSSPINAEITILNTPITKELLNKLV